MRIKNISTTESSSQYQGLEKMSIGKLLTAINHEDQAVPMAVKKAIPKIKKLVEAVVVRMKNGGRLFYIGAGTSGRLGILDASEIPPTFGMPHGQVIGIIAGGDKAIRKAVEFAEDDHNQAWKDLLKFRISSLDVLIGIAASGRTPYVIGGIKQAKANGLLTGCIVCNKGTEVAANVDHAIEVVVGPEFLTGSTRMKSGTAQKLVLNMISTSVMIQLGRVKGNKMVDMKMTNTKLINRGARFIAEELNIDLTKAEHLLMKYGSVRKAVEGRE